MADHPVQAQSAEAVSRQEFLRQGWQSLLSFVAETLPDLPETDEQPSLPQVLRPPGALAEADFLKACEPFCNACRDVCPRNAIFQDAFGFPVIQPEASPCVMCFDVPCTQVCPTDALTPLHSPHAIRLGTAVIELTVCTAFQGSGCTTCYTSCPIPGQAIELVEGLPQIIAEGCTGCGACVYDCPTPTALHIRPLS